MHYNSLGYGDILTWQQTHCGLFQR